MMKYTCSAPLQGHTGIISAIAEIKQNGIIVSTSFDNSLKTWVIDDAVYRKTIHSTADAIHDVAVLDDETLLVTCNDRSARVVRLSDGRLLASRDFPYELASCAAISPKIGVVGDCMGNITKVEWVDKKLNMLNYVEDAHDEGWMSSIYVHGDKFCTAIDHDKGDKTAKLWDSESLSLVHTFDGHEGAVMSAIFNDKYFISASFDDTIRVYDVHTYNLITIIRSHTRSVECVCFIEGTNVIVSGGGEAVLVFHELPTGDCIGTINVGMWIRCIAVLSSGKVAIGGEHPFEIKVFEIDELKKRRSPEMSSSVQNDGPRRNSSVGEENDVETKEKNAESEAKRQFAHFAKSKDVNVLTVDDATDAINAAFNALGQQKQINADEFEDLFLALSDDIQVTEVSFLEVFNKLVEPTTNFEGEYRMKFQKFVNKRSTVSVRFAARILFESFKEMKDRNLLNNEALPQGKRLEEQIAQFDTDGDGKVDCEGFVAAALSIVQGIRNG